MVAVIALGLEELPLVRHGHQKPCVAADLVVVRLGDDDPFGCQQPGALGIEPDHGHGLAHVPVVVVAHGGAPLVLGEALEPEGGGVAGAALHVAGGYGMVHFHQVPRVRHPGRDLVRQGRVGVGHVGGVPRHLPQTVRLGKQQGGIVHHIDHAQFPGPAEPVAGVPFDDEHVPPFQRVDLAPHQVLPRPGQDEHNFVKVVGVLHKVPVEHHLFHVDAVLLQRPVLLFAVAALALRHVPSPFFRSRLYLE